MSASTAPAAPLLSAKTGNAFTFETQTCGRCGGSGQYSFCYSHGSRCFGCNGHGIKLTKRGAAAQAFYNALLTVKAEDVQPGQKVLNAGIPGIAAAGWHTVEAVIREGGEKVAINCDGYGLHAYVGSPVRIARTKEEKAEARAAALVFQAKLTKAGQLRKGETA
jgi:hypothetical protein